MKESHLRSIIKSLSWRITATLTTMLIAYFITGDHEIAIKIGGIEVVVKLLIYYLHERLWVLLPVGTIRKLYSLLK
jgi:uncharacterized membrane protein